MKINKRKTKVTRMNKNTNTINIERENLEVVKTFCYLESAVNRNVDIKEEVKFRIGKAVTVRLLWKAKKILRKAKIKLNKMWQKHRGPTKR